jgi:hypothetical protein
VGHGKKRGKHMPRRKGSAQYPPERHVDLLSLPFALSMSYTSSYTSLLLLALVALPLLPPQNRVQQPEAVLSPHGGNGIVSIAIGTPHRWNAPQAACKQLLAVELDLLAPLVVRGGAIGRACRRRRRRSSCHLMLLQCTGNVFAPQMAKDAPHAKHCCRINTVAPDVPTPQQTPTALRQPHHTPFDTQADDYSLYLAQLRMKCSCFAGESSM